MLLFSVLFVISLPLIAAHSWVERLIQVGLNGTLIGAPGYIRGAVSRLDPGFNDLEMQNLLPPDGRPSPYIQYSDLICKYTQTIWNYSQDLPPLQAHPGDYVALQYQENGHVTLPQNTPQKNSSGNIYIYGTPSPSQNDKIRYIHKVWNKDGTGGDKRGRLLGIRPFDDGRCYQINSGTISLARQQRFRKEAMNPQGADLWCQSDSRLPLEAHDQYTLYWVWDWPSRPTREFPQGQPEIYTSCMDVQILPGMHHGKVSYVKGQDLNLAGIEDQLLES